MLMGGRKREKFDFYTLTVEETKTNLLKLKETKLLLKAKILVKSS